jgi:hypothetical protein
MLPDLRLPKIKDRLLQKLPLNQIDTDPELEYEDQDDLPLEEEDLEIEPKLYEYILVIDRSGSMAGS